MEARIEGESRAVRQVKPRVAPADRLGILGRSRPFGLVDPDTDGRVGHQGSFQLAILIAQ